MNDTYRPKYLILAAAASLGLVMTASAQSTVETASAPAPVVENSAGLLGSGYTAVTFRYTDLDDGPPSALRGVAVEFNQPLQAGYDFRLGYSWARASADPIRFTAQDLNAGVVAYTKLEWGRPFVQALAGWEWQRGLGSSDSSFAYTLGTGVEFAVAPAFALTPYINFVRSTGFNRSEFDYGVKATYRVNRQWSASVGWEYDAVSHFKDRQTYSVGVNYHF
ncbi:MAG TPA: hypothetical protein PLU52_06305 [Opitutaceae bacterium]|nr:hypothetical protein [Opitutaceae bacterium]HND62441.1 hypothetical protein [Opitutaceae bacterium]